MPRTTRHPARIGSGSEQRVRSALITYRLTPDEFAALQRVGEERGLSAAQYARAAALADAGEAVPQTVRRRLVASPELQTALPILAAALGDIRHIRSLLNQLAARSNAGAVEPARAGYAKAEAAVTELANRIVAAALGKRTP